jgi:hypothetical protein
VLAYLMLSQGMTAVEALTEVMPGALTATNLLIDNHSNSLTTQVRKHRDVRPNDGFLRQLAELDNKLRRERGHLVK